jgi:hypothetical protein
MQVLTLVVGVRCGDDHPPSGVTVEELKKAITQERRALDAVFRVLRDEEPQKRVSKTLVGKIRELYPTLRWQR